MPDVYSQIAYLSVVESAANTLTFNELNIASELDKKKAMIIQRIEYIIADSIIALMIAAGDSMSFGISLTDALTSIGMDHIEVFDRVVLQYSAGAQLAPNPMPIDKRFTDMPGGGLLVPVKKLYMFAVGASLASATQAVARVHYTIKDLKTEDYLELVEGYNILK